MRIVELILAEDGNVATPYESTGGKTSIARQGEHNAVQIWAEIPPLMREKTTFFRMSFRSKSSLYVTGDLYPTGNTVIYPLPQSVLLEEGTLKWQISGYAPTGEEEDSLEYTTIVRSAVVLFHVSESVDGILTPPKDVMEAVDAAVALASQATDNANAAAEDAHTLAEEIRQQRDNGDFDGKDGKDGDNGATFTPVISPTGNLSYTNDKGLPNPEPRNITGPQGEEGTQWYIIDNPSSDQFFKFSAADDSLALVGDWADYEYPGGTVLRKAGRNLIDEVLNIMGPTGSRGSDGYDGFSPTITVVENTPESYKMRIVTNNEEFNTPNLKAPGYRHIATAKVTQTGLLSVVISADKNGMPFTLRQAKVMISVDDLSTLPPQGEGSAGLGLGVSINGVSDAVYISGASLNTNWSISAIRNKFYSTAFDLSCHNRHINGIAPYCSIGTTSGGAADTVGYDRLGLATLPHPDFDAIRRVEFFISSSVHRFPLGAEFQLWGVE